MVDVPHRPELSALFELPPQDAIDYLKAKGFKIGWDWHETLDEAHSRAFTVAKVARIDLLQDIRRSLLTALEQGQTLQQWKANIVPILQEKGWWGKQTLINPAGVEQVVQLGSPRRLKTIFDTNVHKALAAGRFKAQMASVETRPFWEWRHISLSNPRPAHVARNGEVRRFDDPFWQYAYPPTEWGCKCKVVARRGSDIESMGLRVVETQPDDIEWVDEKIGVSSFTGEDVVAKRTQIKMRHADGTVGYFRPAAGFNSHPASSYLLDVELTKRAADLMGVEAGLQQVQYMLLAPPRLKAHEAFVKNALSFAKPQNKTSTVGVLGSRDIAFFSAKGKQVESPIITIGDHLLVGKKAQRHAEASNAATVYDWLALPEDMMRPVRVVWDVKNESMLYLLPVLNETLSGFTEEFLKVSIRSQNGVMEVVSIFKVQKRAIVDGLNANHYEVIR